MEGCLSGRCCCTAEEEGSLQERTLTPSLRSYTRCSNETTGRDVSGSQMRCELLAVTEPKARASESRICQMPPQPRCASRGSSGKSKAPVQMLGRAPRGFPVLPDLQQGEQLRCKHWITVSIIDFSVPTEILATKSLAAWRISAVREKVFCLGNLHFLQVWLFVLLVKEGALSSDHPV